MGADVAGNPESALLDGCDGADVEESVDGADPVESDPVVLDGVDPVVPDGAVSVEPDEADSVEPDDADSVGVLDGVDGVVVAAGSSVFVDVGSVVVDSAGVDDDEELESDELAPVVGEEVSVPDGADSVDCDDVESDGDELVDVGLSTVDDEEFVADEFDRGRLAAPGGADHSSSVLPSPDQRSQRLETRL